MRRCLSAALLVVLTACGSPGLSKARLVSYESAIAAPLKDGGRTVEQGMKPALADLNVDHVTPPAMIAREARQWVADLTDVRARVAAVTPPAQLRAVSRGFDEALTLYVEAARWFERAATADALQRSALLDKGYAAAKRADAAYDAASRLLQTARHRVGLGSSPDFPDPS